MATQCHALTIQSGGGREKEKREKGGWREGERERGERGERREGKGEEKKKE